MLDVEKLTDAELSLTRFRFSAFPKEILTEDDSVLYIEMPGAVNGELKIRGEKSLEETLKNVHWVCEKTGMDENVVRKEVLRVFNEARPNSKVELKQ